MQGTLGGGPAAGGGGSLLSAPSKKEKAESRMEHALRWSGCGRCGPVPSLPHGSS